jgi:Dolichyl-phosphate-mannose-protein mannosyltransferase
VFGVRPDAAFLVNAVVMGATVCGLYLLVLMLFNDRAAAFLAGLVMALIPEQLIWSATAAVEPSASLACVIALLAAANATRSTTTVSLAAAAVAAAYAIQFRPESLFILAVAGLLLWRRLAVEWRATRLYWVGLLLLALTATHIGHLVAVRGEGWGTSEARFSLNYLETNLRINGWFYLWDGRFPPLFTVLALVGLPGHWFRTARISLLVYFLVFFGIDLLFYAGSYNYGADVRYSLMTYPPLAALAGVGAARLIRALSLLAPSRWVRCSIPAALTFQLMWYAPLVRATTEEAWAARADVRFASTLKPILAGNSYVLTQNPGMFQVWGINAGQMSLVVQSPGYLDVLASRYAGGVYVHWNFWCNVQDAVQPAICRKAMASGPLELVREYRERDQRYALYRFTRSSS